MSSDTPDDPRRNPPTALDGALFIDVSNTLETSHLSGIQRVTLELAAALAAQTTVELLDGRSGTFRRLRSDQHRRLASLRIGRSKHQVARRIGNRLAAATRPTRSRLGLGAGTVLLDLEASWHAPIARSELLPAIGAHSAALIHDVLPITNPEWFPAKSVSRFSSWFDAHIAAGSTLLAVSNATANAVASLGHARPSVIRLGGQVGPSRSSGNGLLMVGTIEPRKGHEIVLDALDILGAEAPIVDVVGRPGWNTAELTQRLAAHPNVRWHRSIDDHDLETLWSLTGLLLQPSLGEGFGLPVVEGLQRGVAVASSDIAVMAEVGRGATTLVPHDVQAWADVIARFAAAPADWPRPSPLAWPTWAESASDVLQALTAHHEWPDATPASQ